jgi:hypothetical protein
MRYRLRTLLVLVTACCLGLGWLMPYRAVEQRRLAKMIERQGGTVGYDFESKAITMGPIIGPLIPQFVVDFLGVDFFHSVVRVEVRDPSILGELHRLHRLETLSVVGDSLSDDDLEPLSRLESLQCLIITSNHGAPVPTQVGDSTLDRIAHLPALKVATINGAGFTATGLESLFRSRSLRSLDISCYDLSIDEDTVRPLLQSTGVASVRIWRHSRGTSFRVAEKGWSRRRR